MKPETSTVPELLESGICLQASLAQAGFEMRPFIDWAGTLPDVAVFFDCRGWMTQTCGGALRKPLLFFW